MIFAKIQLHLLSSRCVLYKLQIFWQSALHYYWIQMHWCAHHHWKKEDKRSSVKTSFERADMCTTVHYRKNCQSINCSSKWNQIWCTIIIRQHLCVHFWMQFIYWYEYYNVLSFNSVRIHEANHDFKCAVQVQYV